MPSKKRAVQAAQPCTLFGQLDVVLDTLIDILISAIDSSNTPGMLAYSQTLDSVLRALQMTNKEANALVKISSTLKFYRFFLHYCTSTTGVRFLEGCQGISMFQGDFGNGPRDASKFNKLLAIGLMQDRVKTAKTLAKMSLGDIQLRSAHYNPNDVDRKVGIRVRVFVGRTRALAQLFASKHPNRVHQCASCGMKMINCCTEAGQGQLPHPMSGGGEELSDIDDSDDGSGVGLGLESIAPPQTSIWKMMIPSLNAPLPPVHLCSSACHKKYNDELQLAIPRSSEDLESIELSYVGASKIGLPRAAATARAVLRRNNDVLRCMRDARRTLKKQQSKCLDNEQLAALQNPVFDLLNIDAALLMAAGELAESPAMCRGRALPGCTSNWRTEPYLYLSAIEKVRTLYFLHGGCKSRGKQIDELAPPAWMRKIVASADLLFPVQTNEM